jgi:cytoskeletal protein CcmA (bactofilin family)
MFGSVGSKRIKSSKIDTLISAGVEVSGDVKFTGGLHLEGTISGNVTTSDTDEGTILVVSEGGRVNGDVHVAYAVINGEVNGNVYASVKLELSNKARISGDVEYDLLAMASGATINGKMVHNHQSKSQPKKNIPQQRNVSREEKSQISSLKETVTA